VSGSWLVWRAGRPGGGDRLYASALRSPAAPGTAQALSIRAPSVVGGGTGARASIDRPALSGDRLVYATATTSGSRIVLVNLATGRRRTLLASRTTQLSQPSLARDRLLFAQSSYCAQRLRLSSIHDPRRARTLLTLGATARRDAGHEPGYTSQGSEASRCPAGTPRRTDTVLWTTALTGHAAYVTLLRPASAGGAPAAARVVRVRA